jgi:hypothetical protein
MSRTSARPAGEGKAIAQSVSTERLSFMLLSSGSFELLCNPIVDVVTRDASAIVAGRDDTLPLQHGKVRLQLISDRFVLMGV